MTVRRGEDWGRRATRPVDVVEVADDAAAAVLVDAARQEGRPAPVVGLRGGDLRRTLGGGAPVDHLADSVGEYPIDVGLVVLDSFLPMCGKDEDAFSRVDVGTTVEV